MVPMIPAQLDRIQSIAIENRTGASTQPWRTPVVVSNGSDSWPPTLTRDVVPVCRCSISWIRNGGEPDDLSAFHSVAPIQISRARHYSMLTVLETEKGSDIVIMEF